MIPYGEIHLYHKKNLEKIWKVINDFEKIYENTNDDKMKIKILDQIAKKNKMVSDMIGQKDFLKLRIQLDDILDPSPFKSISSKLDPMFSKKIKN